MECALWIRSAERLAVPPDPLVPGPLDLDRPPAPISAADDAIAGEWLGWWHSLVAPGSQAPATASEPAYGTPDPLGLAPYPALAALVTRRWPQVLQWQASRIRTGPQPSPNITEIVRDVERHAGRGVRPFRWEMILLPVRDDVIREVHPERHLVPERVYGSPPWIEWLRDRVQRLGL
jgi:hypothetical protein